MSQLPLFTIADLAGHSKRIQLQRTKGWRKPPGAVVVTRSTRWGNPYKVKPHGPHTVAEAVMLYKRDLLSGLLRFTIADVERDLAGCDLACWCPLDQPCHADILLEILKQA